QKNEVEELSLLDLKEKTKQNKMNELMMIKNYINTYQKMGWQARFITVTNNSTDLPRAYNSKDKQHWDGITTPQDNARRLQQIWRNIQSRAVRNGIEMIGIICREPHKNGGVHMHLLILVAPQHAYDSKKVRKMTNYQTINKLGKYKALKKEILESSMTIEKLFLHAYGYTNRSCKIDVLSGGKKNNNVVNYITKYIMKTIDVRNYNGTELNDTDKKINKISFHRSLWK
ncbi:replication endonuclease, partial [Vibrio aestuarianus]